MDEKALREIVKQVADETNWNIVVSDFAVAVAARAVAAERERCATWLELADGNRDQREHAAKLAALIRKA